MLEDKSERQKRHIKIIKHNLFEKRKKIMEAVRTRTELLRKLQNILNIGKTSTYLYSAMVFTNFRIVFSFFFAINCCFVFTSIYESRLFCCNHQSQLSEYNRVIQHVNWLPTTIKNIFIILKTGTVFLMLPENSDTICSNHSWHRNL